MFRHFMQMLRNEGQGKGDRFRNLHLSDSRIVMMVAIPYMINRDQANLRRKLGFFVGLAGL
jgi:hypothetical protein